MPPVITDEIALNMKLESIVMPYATRQRKALYKDDGCDYARFVHYTSAEAALNIIKTKRLWMRNATCMSDYREVQHGFDILNGFFKDQENLKRFCAAFDNCAPNAGMEAINLFNQWWNDIRFNTYITSISEHDDKEDMHGRLSMWRAFGGGSGNTARVALVIKIPKISGATAGLNIIFSPVAYLRETEVHKEIENVIQSIHANCDFLRTVDRQTIVTYAFYMLVAGVACLKHEGFHEEREWRAIYSPKRSASALIEWSTEIVGGIPQIVHKLPLDMAVSSTLAELDLSRIFDRLIIGPSDYPWPMYEAFVAALNKIGVANAHQLVVTSDIPIRS